MDFENLSPELLEKARACKTPEELVKLAEEEGISLTDEQLEKIAGGIKWNLDDVDVDDPIW